MPINLYGGPKVLETPVRQREATADAFGAGDSQALAGIGQGLADFGAVGGEEALRLKAKKDRTVVWDALSGFSTELGEGMQNAYYNHEGGNVPLPDTIAPFIDSMQAAWAQDLDVRQKEMFDASAQRIRQEHLERGTLHFAKELDKQESISRLARIQTQKENAWRNRIMVSDPEWVKGTLAEIVQDEINRAVEDEGITDPNALALVAQKVTHEFHMGMTKALQGDAPGVALAYMERYKEQMDPQIVGAHLDTLRLQTKQDTAEKSIIAAFQERLPQEAIASMIDNETDVEKRKFMTAEFNRQVSRKTHLDNEKDEATLDKWMKVLRKNGGNMQEVPWDLSGKLYKTLEEYAHEISSRKKETLHPELMSKIVENAYDNKTKFMNTPLRATYGGQVSIAELDTLLALQTDFEEERDADVASVQKAKYTELNAMRKELTSYAKNLVTTTKALKDLDGGDQAKFVTEFLEIMTNGKDIETQQDPVARQRVAEMLMGAARPAAGGDKLATFLHTNADVQQLTLGSRPAWLPANYTQQINDVKVTMADGSQGFLSGYYSPSTGEIRDPRTGLTYDVEAEERDILGKVKAPPSLPSTEVYSRALRSSSLGESGAALYPLLLLFQNETTLAVEEAVFEGRD